MSDIYCNILFNIFLQSLIDYFVFTLRTKINLVTVLMTS